MYIDLKIGWKVVSLKRILRLKRLDVLTIINKKLSH